MHITTAPFAHVNENTFISFQPTAPASQVFAIKELVFHIASMTTPYQYSKLACVNKLTSACFKDIHKIFSARIGLDADEKKYSLGYLRTYAKRLLTIFNLTDPSFSNLLDNIQKELLEEQLKEANTYLSDPCERFVMAKLASDSMPQQILEYLGKFNLSQAEYLEAAKLCLTKDPWYLIDHIEDIEYLTQEACFELVKIAVDIESATAFMCIRKFNRLSQAQRFEIALLCLKTLPDQVIRNIDCFSLNPDQRFKIIKLCMLRIIVIAAVAVAVVVASVAFAAFLRHIFPPNKAL